MLSTVGLFQTEKIDPENKGNFFNQIEKVINTHKLKNNLNQIIKVIPNIT